MKNFFDCSNIIPLFIMITGAAFAFCIGDIMLRNEIKKLRKRADDLDKQIEELAKQNFSLRLENTAIKQHFDKKQP